MVTFKGSKTLFLCSILTFVTFSVLNVIMAFAKETGQYIFYGPAIIHCCRHIELYRPNFQKPETPISVDFDCEKFPAAKRWILKNVYHSLNQPIDATRSKPNYCIALYTEKRKDRASDLLLIVPLTAETLGADFDLKVEALRKIMTSHN